MEGNFKVVDILQYYGFEIDISKKEAERLIVQLTNAIGRDKTNILSAMAIIAKDIGGLDSLSDKEWGAIHSVVVKLMIKTNYSESEEIYH